MQKPVIINKESVTQNISYRGFTYPLVACQLQEIKVVVQMQMSRKKRQKLDGDSIITFKIRIMCAYC